MTYTICFSYIYIYISNWGGHDRMVVGFTTTYAIYNKFLSPLMWGVRIPLMLRCTRYNLVGAELG